MLVLTLKVGERVLVPDLDLTITVVSVKGSRSARLGFSGPLDVSVQRQERLGRLPKKDSTEREKGPSVASGGTHGERG